MGLGNFNDIATFVSVVNAGSFTSAAQQLGITRSAVGKIIARLEERLRVRLLHRTPRSLSLTDDGAVFYARCTQIIEDLEETETAMAVRSATPAGTLRISVPIALGHRHVRPIVEAFLEQWSAVTAEVSFTDRYVDLIDEGIDIAIRIGEPAPDSRLIARTVAQQNLLTCAAPAYVAKHGVPSAPAELVEHECLQFVSSGRPQPWSFVGDDQAPFNPGGRLRMDSAEALVETAVSGVGIIHLPTYLVSTAVKEGRLVPLLEAFSPPGLPIRAIYPTRRHLTPKVRLFIDSLVEAWQPLAPWEREMTGACSTQ
ncbi:LysR family transcriptional regulator [Paraburkholderia saeva]|uniref:HTH-type transcriptional regulator PgrR n=1 Tax=Paraburkholderia saeva TaxID=2777537 RepID=A0A9N8X2X4_9BURK|nr:LysR family transcriptional regulator [Paraburkholderia saeva]CAG4897262.1 HTH-type transcriptional regulator PgrR [Paraburkholderia saeva]CAG4913909.1 HTH-type transcriptional regulator PgrR [Paraburkholderia saeva]CAG4919967.1 HTH-type transcriptional regulator PgrR [Paraburkholderia saeva]